MIEVDLWTGEALRAYAFGDGHPFGPDRLDAFLDEARARGLEERVNLMAPRAATPAELARFHTAAHLERVRCLSRLGHGFLDGGDTPAFPGIYEAAATVVGTTLAAARRLMAGECRRAFVPIAGLHHAARDAAAGFCALNDIGVAVEALEAEHGLERIAYVDIDAHHGDGVYYAFESDPALIVADVHEDGRFLYPGTGHAHERGRGAAEGTKLNVPLPPDAGDDVFRAVWPAVEAFVEAARPQIVLFQCGADSLAGDPITHLRLSAAAHGGAARALCAIADRHCDGRLLAMGGGGYNRHNLALAWCAVLEALLETPAEAPAAA